MCFTGFYFVVRAADNSKKPNYDCQKKLQTNLLITFISLYPKRNESYRLLNLHALLQDVSHRVNQYFQGSHCSQLIRESKVADPSLELPRLFFLQVFL